MSTSSTSRRRFIQTTATGAGMAGVGGRSGQAIPPTKAGRTQRAETKRRTPAQPGLRHAAAGSKGSDAHLRQIALGAPTPPRPGAVTAADQRAALLSSNGAKQTRTLEAGRPSRRRARADVRQPPPPPPAGSSVPREEPRHCGPWRLRRSPPAHAHQLSRSTSGQRQAHVMRSSPAKAETRHATRGRASGVERGHAVRETP